MLDYQDFKDSVSELQDFYGANILNGGILEAAWYENLNHFSLERLQSAIARCFKKHPRAYNFFPSCDQILEFGQGEYRPPGECVMGGFTLPTLPSHEDRLSPEQIAELNKRGRLVARIIINSTGHMTSEKKEQLIEQFKTTPTHELELIAVTSDKTKKSSSFNNIRKTLEKIEQDIAENAEEELVPSEVEVSVLALMNGNGKH